VPPGALDHHRGLEHTLLAGGLGALQRCMEWGTMTSDLSKPAGAATIGPVGVTSTDSLRSEASAPLGLEAPAGNPRFPLIDPLRGLAAVAVFFFHFSQARPDVHGLLGRLMEHADSGVVLFFLISGFLLYRPFVVSRTGRAPRIRTASFYRRRALRILPAYWVALTVLAIYPGLPAFHSRWWQLYLFGQIYDPHSTFAGIASAWTLCVEVSFYALLPVYALGIERLTASATSRTAVKVELAILCALAFLSMAIHELLHADTANQNLSLTLPGTFYLFAAGMGVAVLSVAWEGTAVPEVLKRHAVALWLLAILVYVGIALSTGATALRSVNPVYAPIAVMILLPATVPDTGKPERRLLARAVVWLGVVSYGFYLWHQPILDQLATWIHAPSLLAAAAFAATVLIASVSYKLVEAPWLRSKARLASRPESS
jgi:peptidoglycan/LPS O-acetylase OafA/YrhL